MATRVSDLFPVDALRYEPSDKWVRGEIGGRTVVDSRDVWLVWQPGRTVPGWCFPREHVRLDLLTEGMAWSFDDPDLDGRVQVDYYKLDRWLEEEDQVVGHPRDPFTRVDVRRSSRHVRVEVDGRLVADSRRPLLLFETGLPVRYYLPREDVRMELLTPSDTRSLCAYKGEASYFFAAGAGDIAWTYTDPLADSAQIRNAIAFFNEDVDLTVDGELLARPSTKWSRSAQR